MQFLRSMQGSYECFVVDAEIPSPLSRMESTEATEDDYQIATHRVFVSPEHPSHLRVRVLD